jgi:hypothetical protein
MTGRQIAMVMALFVVVVFPLAMVGAFGLVAVLTWAVADTMHYGIVMFVLGLLFGLVIGGAPKNSVPAQVNQS